jgi:SsrA-binding protein
MVWLEIYEDRDEEAEKMPREQGRTLVASNRKARYDYTIVTSLECGVVLVGTEVKSLRAGRASLVDGFATIRDGEVWLHGVHIPQYEHGNWTNHEPRRIRKLLLHKQEIERLDSKTKQSGLTLIPLSLYFKDGFAKVELALAEGRKTRDKRHAIKERESKRDVQREIGRRNKGMD